MTRPSPGRNHHHSSPNRNLFNFAPPPEWQINQNNNNNNDDDDGSDTDEDMPELEIPHASNTSTSTATTTNTTNAAAAATTAPTPLLQPPATPQWDFNFAAQQTNVTTRVVPPTATPRRTATGQLTMATASNAENAGNNNNDDGEDDDGPPPLIRGARDHDSDDEDDDPDEDYDDEIEDLDSDYEDSDYDDDEDDDDDDSEMGPGNMPPGAMMQIFHHIMEHYHGEDEEDEDDEEEEDDGECTCTGCTMERFGVDRTDDDDEDCAEDGKFDSLKLANSQEDVGVSACAICMEQETAKRLFAILPCCGGNGTDQTSSIRFCQQCLVKYLIKDGMMLPRLKASSRQNNVNFNNNDNKNNDETSDQKLSKYLVHECPRCKHLLAVEEQKRTCHDCDNRKRGMILTKANAEQFYWYIAKKDSGRYRLLLLTLGWVSPDYIPTEYLLNDSSSREKISSMCQWGIIHKQKVGSNKSLVWLSADFRNMVGRYYQELLKKGQDFMRRAFDLGDADDTTARSFMDINTDAVYTMDPEIHQQVRQLFLKHFDVDAKDNLRMRSPQNEAGNAEKQCLLVAANCAASGWMALCKLSFVRMIRMWGRGFTLWMTTRGQYGLPPIPEWPSQEPHHSRCWKATVALNLMMLGILLKVLGHVLWVVVDLARAYGCVLVLRLYMKPQDEAWKRRLRDVTMGVLVLWPLYKLYLSYQYWFPAAMVATDNVPAMDTSSGETGFTGHVEL